MEFDSKNEIVFEVTDTTENSDGTTHTQAQCASVDTLVSWCLLFGVDASTAWSYMLQADDSGQVDSDGRTVWADLIQAVEDNVEYTTENVAGHSDVGLELAVADVALNDAPLAATRKATLEKLGVSTASKKARRAIAKPSALDKLINERKQQTLEHIAVMKAQAQVGRVETETETETEVKE